MRGLVVVVVMTVVSMPAAADVRLRFQPLHFSAGDGEGNTQRELGAAFVARAEPPPLGDLVGHAALGFGTFGGGDAVSNLELGVEWRIVSGRVTVALGGFAEVPLSSERDALETRKFVAASSGRWDAWMWSPQLTFGATAHVGYATRDARFALDAGLGRTSALAEPVAVAATTYGDSAGTYVRVAASAAARHGCAWLEGSLLVVPDLALGDVPPLDHGNYTYKRLDGSPVGIELAYGGPLDSLLSMRGGAIISGGLFPFVDIEARW